MDNKQFPEQESENLLPLEQGQPLPEPEVPEELPVIQELSFVPEATEIPESFPMEDAEPAEAVQDFPESDAVSLFPAEEETFIAAESPALPDAEEVSLIPEPVSEDLTADFRSMQPAAKEEEDLVLDIFNDPEFAIPVPEVLPADDVNDQEYRDNVPPVQPEPAQDPKKADAQRVTRKGRPKRKKGEGLFGLPNILVTFVWLALILAIGVTLGRMLWICAADVLAFGRPDQRVTITVYEADTMEDIINKLHENGLIRYKSLFTLYADISDAEEDIKPGIYDLNTRYDYHALVNFMSPSSTREVIELTIPEGYTCRQIFALLEENRVCTAVDIASYAADGELSDYWFLEELPRGSEYCLEGYLFPDTYQFYKNSSPREALEKMLDNFDYRFTEEMRAQLDTLNANVTDGSFTVADVVIVASLIEKESAAPAESPSIASVIYNRLYNWDYPPLLNIDAAIVYAQGGEADTIDTSIDSPYNTYRYTGLTPTPISNPGLSSLKAALDPDSTDYYFYVLNPATGMHQFSTTQTEHDAWIAQFYN